MIKRAIKPGFWGTMSSNVSYPDWLDLTKYTHDVLHAMQYPVYGDCCIAAPLATDVGKVLTVGANGIVLATLSGSGLGTNISLGTINSTGIQVNSSTGTGLTLPLATLVNAGLLSPTEKATITSLTNICNKEKLDYLTPTGINTIPNLTTIPCDALKVKFYVNGLLERGITSNAAGVVTVNSGILGYNIDTQDLITANYLI